MPVFNGRIQYIPYEIREVEWSIDDYFTVTQGTKYSYCQSPTYTFPEDDGTWHLEYFSRWNDPGDDYVGLYLLRSEPLEHKVEYTFGLRKCDGNIGHTFRGIMGKGCKEAPLKPFDFIKKNELVYLKSELVPDDTLTIICTLKFMTETTHSTQEIVSDEIRISKLTRLDVLSGNLRDLFAHKEACDVTLRVQEKEYKAHKSILIARSKVFAANFKHDTVERQTGVITISDCDPDSFEKFLEYLYSGEIEELCCGTAIALYYTSDKYDIEELKEFCVEYLMQHLTVENICDIAAFADKYEEKNLFSKAQDFFNENVKRIFVTSHWESLLKIDHRLANKLLIEMSNVKHD